MREMQIRFRRGRRACHEQIIRSETSYCKKLVLQTNATKTLKRKGSLRKFVNVSDFVPSWQAWTNDNDNEELTFTKSFIQRFGSVLYMQLFIYFMNVLPYRAHRNAELVSDLFV